MNATVSVLQAQIDALLRRVAREQDTRTRRIRDEADEQARAIVARSRQEARARLRQAIDEERRQIERAIADRRAARDTDARRAEQAAVRQLIERAWARLPQAVAARWVDSAAREDWCRAACDCARRSLRDRSAVVVEVDAEGPAGAGQAAQKLLHAHGLEGVAIREVAGLGPGLRIRGGSACVDATVGGLLASRERVEAELLAEFDRLLGAKRGGEAA